VDKINSLRSKVKRYIHDLEMPINQKGQALTVMQLREERVRVQQRVEELEAVLPCRKENISKPGRNGLTRDQVSRTTLRGSLSSRKPTNFVWRK
jgi:hypothetical protein